MCCATCQLVAGDSLSKSYKMIRIEEMIANESNKISKQQRKRTKGNYEGCAIVMKTLSSKQDEMGERDRISMATMDE